MWIKKKSLLKEFLEQKRPFFIHRISFICLKVFALWSKFGEGGFTWEEGLFQAILRGGKKTLEKALRDAYREKCQRPQEAFPAYL